MNARNILLAAIPLIGCGGEDKKPIDGDEGPVYVMMTQVYTADDRIIYFSTSDTLDIDGVSFGDATESPGVANFTTLDGKLYISSGEEPKITQYDVLPDRSLKETGVISFGAYPLGDNANFYYHYIVNEELAYLPYETTKRIAWSPKDMTILSDKNTSTIPEMDGLLLVNSGGNRTGVKYPSGPVMQPFFYTNEEWSDFGTKSRIVTYDKTSHDEAKVQEVACPGLTLTTRDESGYTYFSTNAYSALKHLFNAGPAPCIVRAKPDGDIDTAWTTDLSSQIGGRYVTNFRYLGNGFAFAWALDHEALGLDFNASYDPTFEELTWAPEVWDLYLFNLKTNTAKPITGFDAPGGDIGQHAVIDGRMFLFAIFDDYGKTRVYELSEDGALTKKFDVNGDVFKWEKLR